MVFGGRGRFLLISCLFLQFTGTIFATDENAARRQYVFNATENYNPAVACTDSTQRSDICALAGKRCHCEENRYEMYTYCKRSCGYCNEERLPQRFWRVVNWAPLNRTWFVSEIQFFKSRHDKNPLPTNIAGNAIASSTYLSFPASHAFDGNRDTAWLPDGWWERIAGGDWIGYDFPTPVDINSVRVISDYNDTSDVAAKILVEAGPTAFGPFQTRWMSINGDRKPDKRFNNPRCPLFWKRFMTDKYAFCYKLVTEYLTWSEARDKCGAYGGDLVSINTHEEQVFVQQELLACGYTWLGLNDRAKEAEFTWSDSGKNSTFFYWADDIESDDRMNDMEDCVAMQKNGEWRTFHCDNRFYFFCKKRILTDNDKIVEPNTAQRPTQPINQTLPEGVPPPVTPLPPEIEFPPGVTPPPPPPYPYPYPTPYPQHRPTYAPPETAPGIFMQQIMQHLGRITQQILNPKGTPTAAPPATQTPTGPAPAPPPDTGGPAPATPPAAPPVPGLPPPAPGAQPPTPAAQPPVPAALPPVVAPPPVAPPPVVAPAPHPKHHKHHVKKAKKKHHKAFHSTIKYRRKKRVKRNHKKKAAKKNIKKQWHDKMEADDDFKMDDDFLDMFTRSNIPQPKISENQLRSNVKKEQVQNAQEQQKEDTIQANSSS